MVSEELVRSCLYNWLGYGNVNSPIWFIGTEEGGAEVWRAKTLTLESSLLLRKNFNLSMDFYNVWEELYGINLSNFKGITVWHFIAKFMLSLEGSEVDSKNIRNYIFNLKKLGSFYSKHFLCELLPLPKKSKGSIGDYKHIWPNIGEYTIEVLPNRIKLITDTLIENGNVKLIVSYEKSLTSNILSYLKTSELIDSWNFGKQKYYLHKIEIDTKRSIYLLSTPFFGQGQISYDGIHNCVQRIKSTIGLCF